MNKIAYLVVFTALASCAHRTKDKVAEEVKIQDPSVLDPARPPTLRMEGLEANGLLPEGQPLVLKVWVDNYPLGPGWQAIEVVLNDQAPVRVFENGATVSFKAGFRKGGNVVRAYLLRSWGESIKVPQAFAVLPFYYMAKAGLPLVVPGRPVLTLVSPYGTYREEAAKQILFDFMVWDGPQSNKTHVVHYTLDGRKLKVDSGKSYHFYNLNPGDHDLLVEVVNSRDLPYGQEVTRARSRFSVLPSEDEDAEEDSDAP